MELNRLSFIIKATLSSLISQSRPSEWCQGAWESTLFCIGIIRLELNCTEFNLNASGPRQKANLKLQHANITELTVPWQDARSCGTPVIQETEDRCQKVMVHLVEVGGGGQGLQQSYSRKQNIWCVLVLVLAESPAAIYKNPSNFNCKQSWWRNII